MPPSSAAWPGTAVRSPVGPGEGLAASADPGRLAVLSRHPIEVNIHSNLAFTIEGTRYRCSHPPMEIVMALPEGPALRVWNLNFHGKTWHVAGQHEVRRNEARLAWQEIRRIRGGLRDQRAQGQGGG